MASRTTFTQSANYVTVTVDGESTEYFVPSCVEGGAVRIWDASHRYPQVCECLYSMGSTLSATSDTLLALIRREHARANRLDRKQAARSSW